MDADIDPGNLATPARGMVTVRFWAAARAAAGVSSAEIAAGALPGVLRDVTTKYPQLSELLPRCSVLVDGIAVGRGAVASTVPGSGAVIEILPPFAGG